MRHGKDQTAFIQTYLGTEVRSPGRRGATVWRPGGRAAVRAHLHLLHHLLAKGADLGGAGDGHVLGTLVLAGHPVEGAALILDVGVEVCLEGDKGRPRRGGNSEGPCWGRHRGRLWGHSPGPRARTPPGGSEKTWTQDLGKLPRPSTRRPGVKSGRVPQTMARTWACISSSPDAHWVPKAQQAGPQISL